MYEEYEEYERKVFIVYDNIPYAESVKTALDDLSRVRFDRIHEDTPYPKIFGISNEGIPYLMKPEFEVGQYDENGFRFDRIILTFKDGVKVYTYCRIDGNS